MRDPQPGAPVGDHSLRDSVPFAQAEVPGEDESTSTGGQSTMLAPNGPTPATEAIAQDAVFPRSPLNRFDRGFGLDLDVGFTPTPEMEATLSDTFAASEGAGLPGMGDDAARTLSDLIRRQAIDAYYGSGCPLGLEYKASDNDWVNWAWLLWGRYYAGVQRRLWLTDRNRLFRSGIQWLSALGLGPWREPAKPRDAARCVYNMVRPALDQRVQIVSEQRPGFRTKPTSSHPDAAKKAEAQQRGLEYQYDQQKMPDVIREAAYWAGTDGVAFLHSWWNPERGPWDELEVKGADNQGQPIGGRMRFPLGDIETCVHRMDQVRVSADATATRAPKIWIIRESIPKQLAVAMHGAKVLEQEGGAQPKDPNMMTDRSGAYQRMGYALPGIEELHADQDTVDKYTVYCERSEFLPEGLTLVVVGKALVFVGPLLYGCVPIVRFTDGSTDPAFYPTPIMEDWIEHQMRINATLSKWVESVRRNADGRILSRGGAISTETLLGGTLSVIDVRNVTGPIGDAVMPISGFSVGQDTKELLAVEKKAFEDKSGWNDTSRGSFASDQSGRAILAIREQLERVFAPAVNAAARAMQDWATVQLHMMKWGYEIPRQVAALGADRPDLGMALSSEVFDGVAEVTIDPETLMPMPRALRLYLLNDLLGKGMLSVQEYRRRLPFAFTKDLESPDEDQYARGMRIVEAIKRTGNPMALPLKWQDDESAQQDILQREILRDDLDPMIWAALNQRWAMLGEQAMAKQQLMAAAAGAMAGQPGGGGGEPPKGKGGNQGAVRGAPGMDPRDQPMLGGNPSIASAPANQLTKPDAEATAQAFDQQPH